MPDNKLSVGNLTDFIHSAAGNFDGAHPDGAMTAASRGFTWAAGTHQGMVDPLGLGIEDPLRIHRLYLVMAGQTTWTVNLIDGTSSSVLASGTNETKYIDDQFTTLMSGQKLQVITTGAGTTSVKMIVTVSNALVYPHYN